MQAQDTTSIYRGMQSHPPLFFFHFYIFFPCYNPFSIIQNDAPTSFAQILHNRSYIDIQKLTLSYLPGESEFIRLTPCTIA